MIKPLLKLSIPVLAACALIILSINRAEPVYMQDFTGFPDLTGINVYFSEANTESSQFDRGNNGVSRFAALLRRMGAATFTLEWRKGIPEDASLIVIPSPRRDMTPEMVARLWAFLQRGGRVLLLVDSFDPNGAQQRFPVGWFELTWNDLGLRGRGDTLVVPGELRTITRPGANGAEATEVDAPTLAISFLTQRLAGDHPITAGLTPQLPLDGSEPTPNLTGFYFNGSRSIELNGALGVSSVTPLVFTDIPGMYGETNLAEYTTTGYSEFNIGTDTAPGDLILALAYEDPALRSRMVVIGDGDFIQNGGGFVTSPSYSGSFVYPLNVQFAIRSVAWLLERDIVSVTLPTPAPTATPTTVPSPTPLPTPTPTATPSS